MFRFLVLFFCIALTASCPAQSLLRPAAMIAWGDNQWLLADAGTGELFLVESDGEYQRHTFGATLREPVALARDGVFLLCFDRSENTIVKLNRRLEVVETMPLPVEYRNRFRNLLAVTQFGERLLIETDRNEIIAFDAFAKETWRIPLPLTQSVLALSACGDSIAVLFDSSDNIQRGIFTTRFGGTMKSWQVPTSVMPMQTIIVQDRSCWALRNHQLWRISNDSTAITQLDTIATPWLLAASSRHSLAFYTSSGIRILPWR
ncbi:MAG: hypothetical protein OEM52_07370 [bacterium]|nr:hypothetical protein [bacterium]